MNTQAKPKLRSELLIKQAQLKIGDLVKVAGISKHEGEIVDIKVSSYSGLTYSVKVGGKRLDGVNPLALTSC